MKTIAFFNNKGGVGKTTLVYHFSYMLAELGYTVLAADLDPQTNLTSMFLKEEQLNDIYLSEENRPTIMESIRPLDDSSGDFKPVDIVNISERIGLIAGDLELSLFEDKLSYSWERCLDEDKSAFRITSVFYRMLQDAGERTTADFCVIDMGSHLGALNRAVLIAADYVVLPMAADLFSLQGIKNLGSRLTKWRKEWRDRLARKPKINFKLPSGNMKPIGYIIMQHGIIVNRPVKAYLRWTNRIPLTYVKYVLRQSVDEHDYSNYRVESDDNCLALLKHYHSLAPLSMEARKPIFFLKPADGAIGAHLGAVRSAYRDFERMSNKIVNAVNSEAVV